MNWNVFDCSSMKWICKREKGQKFHFNMDYFPNHMHINYSYGCSSILRIKMRVDWGLKIKKRIENFHPFHILLESLNITTKCIHTHILIGDFIFLIWLFFRRILRCWKHMLNEWICSSSMIIINFLLPPFMVDYISLFDNQTVKIISSEISPLKFLPFHWFFLPLLGEGNVCVCMSLFYSSLSCCGDFKWI